MPRIMIKGGIWKNTEVSNPDNMYICHNEIVLIMFICESVVWSGLLVIEPATELVLSVT